MWQDVIKRLSDIDISIGKPAVSEATLAEALKKAPGRGVIIAVPVTAPEPGVSVMFFPLPIGSLIPERIINPQSTQLPSQFSDLHKSAFEELAGQAWQSVSEQFGGKLGRSFKTGQPEVALDAADNFLRKLPAFMGIEKFIVIEYPVRSGFGPASLIQIMPADFVNALFSPPAPERAARKKIEKEKPVPKPEKKKMQALDVKHIAPAPAAEPKKKASKPPSELISLPAGTKRNLEVLLDVPVTVTAEIGRARIPVEKLLNLAPGSVFELDTNHGKPIRVLVNGRVVALAQVVTVGDKFGAMVVEIVEPKKRLEEF